MRTARILSTVAFLCLLAVAPAFGAATITIVNVDGPNEGFNDPTPAVPVGGNPGVTLGEQRQIAFQFAADIWGAFLNSDVEIFVQSSFDPLTCTATSAVLGAAGSIQILRDFPGAELPNTGYHGALANKLAGADLAPGPGGSIADDLVAFFNSDIDNQACLGSRDWYYGLDTNHAGDVNLISVLLHEFGHGLGFSNFVTEQTGASPQGRPDVFSEYTFDVSTGKIWNQMTQAERQASAINARKVVWKGLHVTNAIPTSLALGTPLLRINAPAALGSFEFGTAAFGAPLNAAGVTGNLVQAIDASTPDGPTTLDGCTPFTNAAAVAGNIALIDRGTCGFTVKVKNAQNAGAIAVVVADNLPGAPPAGLGGVDPTITIPSGRVTLPDGNAIKAALAGGVNVTLGLDMTVRAGTEKTTGLVHLNAPNPVQPGSSISHWDPITFPNTLMEPSINNDLLLVLDLTEEEMIDVGWFSDGDGVPDGKDACIGSDPSATIVIDGCDSGVANTLFADGCKISDAIEDIAAGAGNHGAFVSGVSHYLNELKKAGIITGAQKDAIQACAGAADIP